MAVPPTTSSAVTEVTETVTPGPSTDAPPSPNGPGGPSRPTGPRAEAREQAILDAALELLKEVGYDRLSMDALAERARAGKATIYRHWSGKAEVVAEAVRRRQCEAEGFEPDTGSLRGDLLATLEHMGVSMSAEDGALISGVLHAMRADPVLAELMRTQVFESKHSVFQAVVGRAVARGELPATANGDLLYEVMPAMVVTRLVLHGDPLTEAFNAHLVDDILIPLLRR